VWQAYFKRTKGLFDSKSKDPFKLSRSKIDLYAECPRCFYLDVKLGIGKPRGFPFTLNSAVDTLLKKEFDIHRAHNRSHPLMEVYGIDAVPFAHEKLEEWRDAMKRGITCIHEPTNLKITGGIDDVWVNKDDELMIVDYKATSKTAEVTLDAEWQDGYKRQIEIYQWLFRQNGFKVSDTGYFVYANGKTDREAFDGKLEFDVKIIPYTGSTDWIEQTLKDIRKCLESDDLPPVNDNCEYCGYIREASPFIEKTKIEVKKSNTKVKKEIKKIASDQSSLF